MICSDVRTGVGPARCVGAAAGPGAAAECGGTVFVKLAEGCASKLLGSALCVELVVPLRQGASPRVDGGTLDVLGFADFALARVVRGPQPVYVLRVALLDD